MASAAVGALVTLALASRFGASTADWRLAGPLLAAPATAWALHRWQARRVLTALMLAAPALGVLLLITGRLPALPYGDGPLLATFLEQSYVFPRWLLGMAFANALYAGLWQFPPIAASLPAALASASAFATLLCLVCMAVASAAILERWNRLAVHCALLTPVWFLFSSGYVEYYPLIIGVWVAALAWTFERPLCERPGLIVGLLVGVLPAVYVAFVGLSLVLAVTYAIRRPREALAMTAAAAVTLAVAISLAYPTIPDFLRQLYAEMNLGDVHSDARYVGFAASPTSVLLATRYVFRGFHLWDVTYMMFWGGGWLALPALVVFAVMRSSEARWRDDRLWIGVALFVFYAGYLLWMIPKKGPLGDLDLFSPVFVLFSFLAGLLAEGTRWRHVMLGAVLGVTAVTVPFLVWLGLPVP